MTTPTQQIPLSETPGKTAWIKSVQVERIMLQLRALAVEATYRGSADVPMPAELEMWAKDLRRGRMHVAGSMTRFIQLLERRNMGIEGRRIALEATKLVEAYIDIALPAAAPDVKPTRTHVVLYSKFLNRSA